ncbi:MAG: hypothetical protein KF760_35125 [Candidatus Eremiobacteraeota bacterium]|nr:hypothetical protein [Candidatus Eremiobacteraeota bacterium]
MFFIMVVLILLIASLFRLVPQEVRWTGDHRRETFAYYACTGGVKHALSYLRQVRTGGAGQTDPFKRTSTSDPYEVIQVSRPDLGPLRLKPSSDMGPTTLDTYFPPNIPALHSRPGRIRLGEDWRAEVWVFPDKNTSPHPFLLGKAGKLPPCYTIVAAAFRDINNNGVCDLSSGENYVLRAESSMVERTFARYAYFVDLWKDQGADTTALRVQNSLRTPIFDGPVHSNDTPVIEVSGGLSFWQETGFPAPFGAELSFAGDLIPPLKAAGSYDGVAYLGGNFRGDSASFRPYEGERPPFRANEERYKRLFRRGQGAIQRTSRLELPEDWSRLAAAAWGAEAGREVDVETAPANRVFVNTEDLGIVSTGALRELRLDIVDNTGRSTVFNNDLEVTSTASAGHQVVNLQQLQEITYLTQETVTREVTVTETGPYTMETTLVSDTPQPGYSPQDYSASIDTTTAEVQRYVITGYETVTDPPGGGGAGPANAGAGGNVLIPRYAATTVTINVPVFEQRTRYVQVTTVTGDGPHDVASSTTGLEDVTHYYAPQDAIVAAVDAPVKFPVNYFLPRNLSEQPPQDQFPIFSGTTDTLDITVPRGKSLVVHQDRETGRTFDYKILDGVPSGVVGVGGRINSLRGVNRGAKTVFALDPDTPRLAPTALANVTLTDHLLQFKTPLGSLPTSGDHSLGVIGANISLNASNDLVGRHTSEAHPLYLYASIFAAQGSFAATNLPKPPSPVLLGEVRIVGGVLQKVIGPLISGARGWSSGYLYDNFLRINPPPIFPPDGRFDVTFYRITAP